MNQRVAKLDSYRKMRIGDLCKMERGTSPTMKTLPGRYPLVVTAEYRRSSDDYQFDAPAVCVPLISSTGHGNAALHRVHYQEGKFALANLLVALLPDPAICFAKYLYYLLTAEKDHLLVPLMSGTANVSLKEDDIAKAFISLPPLSEQRRIVARIEELAGRIAEAKGLQQHLVEEHTSLYPSLRDQVFRQLRGKRKPIAELFTLLNGRAFGPEEWELEGRPIIRIQNLKYPGTPFNRYSGTVDERHLVRSNDVLFAWSGQIVSLGAHVWEGEEGILNQHIFKVVSKSHSLPGFVQEGFNFLVDEMASQVRGLEMFHIRKQELERIQFPDLEIAEQKAVVDRLQALKAMTNRAVVAGETKKRELDALLPSILDRAFRGEL